MCIPFVLALAFSSVTAEQRDMPVAIAPGAPSQQHVSATALDASSQPHVSATSLGAFSGALVGQATALGSAALVASKSVCIVDCNSVASAAVVVPAYLVPAFVVPVVGTVIGHVVEHGHVDAVSLLAGTAAATTMTIGATMASLGAVAVATTIGRDDPILWGAPIFVAGAITSAALSGVVAEAIDGGSHDSDVAERRAPPTALARR